MKTDNFYFYVFANIFFFSGKMQYDIIACRQELGDHFRCIGICTASTYFDLFIHIFSGNWLDVEALATALALTGKASVVSCFCIIFIYSSELFPTVIRTVGMGCCAFWGRVGSLLAPQILLLVSISNNFTQYVYDCNLSSIVT